MTAFEAVRSVPLITNIRGMLGVLSVLLTPRAEKLTSLDLKRLSRFVANALEERPHLAVNVVKLAVW